MSKFFKSLLLLLSAGLFTATGWADSLIARWDNFTGLTSDNTLAPTASATVNGLNGGSWTFNLGGGTVTDGVLATGSTTAPKIAFDQQFDTGRTSKPITVLVAVQLPYTPVNTKPILHIGNGTTGYGLTATNNKNTFESSWQNQRWSNTPSKTIEGMGAESGVVYLVYSVADTSTNASVTSVTLDTATYTWQIFSGLTGTGVNANQITFGNFVNATSGGLDYKLKSVAVFNGAFAPLADVKDVIRAWEGVTVTDVATAISGATSWSDAPWDPSKPANDASNVTLTVSGEQTLTMDESASVISLTVNGAADGENALTIAKTDSNKLTVATTTINTDITVNAGAASLGAVTVAGGKTLTVNDQALTSASGSGNLIKTGEYELTLQGDVSDVVSTYEVNEGKLIISNRTSRPGGLQYNGGVPSYKVAGDAHLVWDSHDIIGWERANTVPVAEISGVLEKTYNANETFSGRLLLKNGGELRLSAPNDKFMLHNSAIIAVDDDASAKITGNRLKMNGGTPEINVGENATLSGETFVELSTATKKTGTGTWEQKKAISGGGALTVEGGTLTLMAAVNNSGTMTVESGTLRLDVNKGNDAGNYTQALPEGKVVTVNQNGILELYNGYGYFATTGAGLTKVTGDFYFGVSGNDDNGNPRTNTIGTALEVTNGSTLYIRNWREGYQLAPSVLRLNGTIVSEGYENQYIKDFSVAPAVLSGNGTIGSDTLPLSLTLPENATIDAAHGAVTVKGAVTLPTAMTVKISEVQLGTIPLLNTTAFASNTGVVEGTTLTVKVDETVMAGTFQLVKTATALELKTVALTEIKTNTNTSTTIDKATIRGVQVDLDDSTTNGVALDPGYYALKSFGILQHESAGNGITGIPVGRTISVYESEYSESAKLGTSRALTDADKVDFVVHANSGGTQKMCTFVFDEPIILDASKTYLFIASDTIRPTLLSYGNSIQTAVLPINVSNNQTSIAFNKYTPVIQMELLYTYRDAFEIQVPANGTTLLNELPKVMVGDVVAPNPTLTINFEEPGTFTFDNDDEASFAEIIVTGSAGGTIAKAEGAAAVTTELASINTAVTVNADVATFTAVDIAETGALTVSDTATVGAVTGSGVLAYNGVLPENVTGTNVAAWKGMVELSSVEVPEETYLTLNNYGNSASKICLNGVTNIGFVQNNSATQTYAGALCIEGTNTVTKAGEYSQLYLLGAIEGDGVLDLALVKNHNYCITGSLENFSGTLKNAASTNTKVILGSASWTTWNDFDTYTNSHAGKLIVDGTYVLSGSGTYQFVNGIFVCQTATLKGAVILKDALILEAGATIDASETLLTVTGDVTLPTALTVKVATEPTMTVPVTILNTTATPNTASTTVTVKMGNETLEGPFELIKNGEALQVRVAPDRIAASETPVSVTEVPDAIFLDTATFSGYGQTFTVLQYTGDGTPDWDGMYVEGLPDGAEIITTDTTWGFAIKTLNVLTVGDSITAGLVTYHNSSANWHVPGGYRLPLYKYLTRAGYSVKYLGASDVFGTYSGGHNPDEANPSPSLGDNDHHEGHSGTTLDEAYDRFGQAKAQQVIASQGTPDVITLHLGTNDMQTQASNTEESVATQFEEMKKLLYRLNGACDSSATDDWKAEIGTPLYPNAKIIVAKIIPRGDSDNQSKVEKFNLLLTQYVDDCDSNNLVLVTLPMGERTSYGYYRHDYLHPSTEGYTQMAKGWFDAIDAVFDPFGEQTEAPTPVASTPTTDVTEADPATIGIRSSTATTIGPFKAAEWTTFAEFKTGYLSQHGYMLDSERPWQLDIRGTNEPEVTDGVLSLNGAPLTVNVVDGRLGTTSGTYTMVMKVSDLAAGDVIFTDAAVQCTDWPSAKGETVADLGKLTVVDADTLAWSYKDSAAVDIDLSGVDLTDTMPDTIAVTIANNQCTVAVDGGASVTKTAGDTIGETYRGNFSIGALSTAETGSSMKLYRLSFYEGEATLPPPATVTVNVGDYASWNAALEAGAVSNAMASVTLNFTDVDQTFTFDNTTAVRLGIVTVTAAEGVTGGTIALASNVEVKMASLSLQTNVTAPVAFYNACIGSITADSATTVVAMNDATAATLTTPIVGGVLKQVGEGTITFAPTGNWTASTSPAKFEVANGSLVLNKTSTGWNNPPQLIVSGGTLDLNNVYTYHDGGSGYLKNVANEPLVVMGGTEASTVTNGAITPWTSNTSTTTMIQYVGASGANAPATFAADIAGVYSQSVHTRLINVEQGKQTDGYDLEISGTMGVEGQQFAGTTVKKTGAGVLKISGENNFNTLEVTEGTLWSANANALSATTTVKSGATLVGAGTVATAFTLEENATLDVTKGVVTANGTVSLPNALKLVVETLPTAETHVTILSTTAFADATGDVDATLTINGNAAPDYILRKTADAVELHYAPWTTVQEVTASGNVKSWSALLAGMEANREVLDASTGVFIIDFGNADGEAVPGSFEFNNTDTLTFASVKVMGSNGGTITKTGSGAVSATATTIEEGCTVTVPASTATLNAVEIKQNATLKVADVTTVTTATGVGTLYVAGIDGNVGLKLKGVSADTKIVLDGVRCYIDNGGNGEVECPIEIGENGFTIMNGWATGSIEFSGALTGEGMLTHAPKQNGTANGTSLGYLLKLTNAEGFEGGITLDGEYTKVVIGSGTAVAGKIVIAASVTIAQDATWTATNGISVTGEGTISGAGTISIPSGKELTYASTAESTFSGTIAGEGGLTVSTGTLALTKATTYTGATTIAQDAKLKISGADIFAAKGESASAITVNGELYIDGASTSFYRVVNGEGKITIPTGKTLALGAPWTYKTNPAGLYGFTGELEIAGTFDARSWSGADTTYDLTGFDVVLDGGTIVRTAGGGNTSNLAPATLTIATDKKLSGSGTIDIPLTLADGATIDVTGDVVTANTVAALPASLSIMVNELPTEGNPVTLLNTTAFASNEGYASVALTVNGEATEDYILHKTATALTLVPTPSWTMVTEVTASGDVDSWSELLADMAAKRQQFDTTEGATPSLIIDFGNKGEDEATPGTFTFDLEDATALSLTKVTIQGTNGGTIQKSGTANVTATATVVNTNVEITANAMLLGTTTLADGCTLTVNDSNALGEAANFSAGAGSTVKLVNVDKSTLDLGKLTNAEGTSNLILNNVKAYIYDCTINTLTLEGNFQMNNGTTDKDKTQCVTVNTLAGAGTFIGHQGSEVYVAVNVKAWEDFTGSIDLSHEKSAGTIFFFGEAPERFTDAANNAYDADDAEEYFANDYGTVYVMANETVATDADSTWKLQKLVVEDGAAFQINGWATIATSCTGAVTVENGGVLDLRTLTDAQLEAINVTVKAGGRLLVNTGATVPANIVFEDDSILGVATKHVEDVGNATLTVNVNGTAATVPTIKGYHTDGVTELDNWAKNNETSSEGEFKFNFDPVFDGELCWWAYEFDNEVNTTAESNLGPISTGRDKGRMNFDGRGDSNRVCQGDEYVVTSQDGAPVEKAIRVASSPWRDVNGGYPTAFTAAMYGTLTSSRNRIIMGFGSSYNQKYTIALVTGASTDEVRLVLQKGWNENNTDYPEDAVITLATTTVPNAVTENHLFAFSYEQFDSEDDGEELDSTRIIFYVDGEKYQPFTAKAIIPLGNGFQMGSIHGGWHNSLTRMNGDDVDCTMEYLRIYDQILPESVWTAMSNEYSYMSKNGRATRTIVAGQDATWNENTEWEQVRAVKDGNGDYVLDANGHVTFDSGTAVEKPDHGENVGTQVVLNVDGANTLFLNEFYSSPLAEGETKKLYYERLEINGVEGGDEDSLTLWAGRNNENETAENKTKQSAVINVQGYTKINTNVTMAHNVAFLSGPVAVAEGKYLHFDFSGFDVMQVPSLPVTYRLTGFLDEDTRTRVTSTAPADPVNARSIDLGYKTNVNQYTFTVDRYPVTAYFTADDDPMVAAHSNDTTIDFNALYYIWQGNEMGKQMNWAAEAVNPQGQPIVENTLAKFVSLDAETQQEKMVTVTLATNDLEGIELTLDEAALTKETTPAGTDGEGNPTEAVVENMLGAEQLIVAEKVTVNYTGENVSTLAPFVKEASGMVKATAMGVAETTTEWRGNLTLDNGEDAVAIVGTNTVSGKLVLGKKITLATGATLSAKDADFTAVTSITVDYEEAVAAGTYKVVGLEAGHTAKSLIGCVVTAVKDDTSTVEWTESGDYPTLVVVRADGLYVVARPDVTVTTNETTKVIDNEDLTLPLARRAAELSATSVSLTGVVNTAGETVNASVADAAEVFTNVAFDMDETVVDGVVTAKLKYDFGVTKIGVVKIGGTEYVVAELIVSNHENPLSNDNTADFAVGAEVNVMVNGVSQTVDQVAGMDGSTNNAVTSGKMRYIRFPMPSGNGTFEIKARASKNAKSQ